MVDSRTNPENRRIAMLIDGDNAQPSLFTEIIAETSRYGIVTIRRIYGDWTTTNMKGWKEFLNDHAIQPIQQFRYTTGKNATDSALIIDAMDILYEGVVGGFCIVASDSDYTRLATRLREKGSFVMGIGQRITPKAFVNACEIFVYTENLRDDEPTPVQRRRSKKKDTAGVSSPDPSLLLKDALDKAMQEDGWAFLGNVGTILRQLDPSFDPRTYGHRQLSQLIRAYPGEFEVREEKSASGPSQIYVRAKENAAR